MSNDITTSRVRALPSALNVASLSDTDIRTAARAMLRANTPKGALILDELRLARARAILDLAVIDGSLHGYEIKSDIDSLQRLPRQIDIYNRSCNMLTLITAKRHLTSATKVIPAWWGLIVVEAGAAGITLTTMRQAAENPTRDTRELVSILRRTELLRILHANQSARNLSSSSKSTLVSTVFRILGEGEAQRLAVEILRFRRTWTARQLSVATESERLHHAVTRPTPNLTALAPSLFA